MDWLVFFLLGAAVIWLLHRRIARPDWRMLAQLTAALVALFAIALGAAALFG